jgi:tRNA(Ile)-lysidine synthetase-like protein
MLLLFVGVPLTAPKSWGIVLPTVARRRISITTALKQRLPEGGGLLLAVSGGKDSSVLLHATLKVQRLLKLRVEVCHVDHGLRPESGDDAAFVAEQCRLKGIECHVVRLGARPKKVNLEAWAREERYRAFRSVMRERDLRHLVTAHTANDVAETLLIRLFANKELTSIEESDERRGCLRPLLGISREQIDRYAEENGIPFVDDASNNDTTIVRNRVRRRVIPLLEREFDPSIVWSLSERAQAIASDCEALSYLARGVADRIGQVAFDDQEWLEGCLRQLSPQPYAVQWRVAQLLFTPLFGFSVGESRARALLDGLRGEVEGLDCGIHGEIRSRRVRSGQRVLHSSK